MFKKFSLLMIILAPYICNGATYQDGRLLAEKERLHGVKIIKSFKDPKQQLDNFNRTPSESSLMPSVNNDTLNEAGAQKIMNDPLGVMLLKQAQQRSKTAVNLDSDEFKFARDIINQSSVTTKGGCYKVPKQCQLEQSTKTCSDLVTYKSAACTSNLNVSLNYISSQKREYKIYGHSWGVPRTINLSSCNRGEMSCQQGSLVKLSSNCKRLNLKISLPNVGTSNIKITKPATCTSPSITFIDYSFSGGWLTQYDISVQELGIKDVWTKNCDNLSSNQQGSMCYAAGDSQCLEPNKEKNVNGIAVKRACWKKNTSYQCMQTTKGNCDALIKDGCTQINSKCELSEKDLCRSYYQTFQCTKQTCTGEKEVCTKPVECADGSCQIEANKKSTKKEMGQGLTHLAALVSSGQDVHNQNLSFGTPHIFSSKNITCRKDVLDVANCCVNRARELGKCTKEEVELADAKKAGLAVYVGTFEAGWFGAKKQESWCKFDSKLAYLIRVEGGVGQLHLGFGWANGENNAANCQGLSPEQLGHINLEGIHLSEFEKGLVDRFNSPNSSSTINVNMSHIERLQRGRKAHD